MARRRTKRKYTITDAVRNKKPKVAFTGYSYVGGLKVPSIIVNKLKKAASDPEKLAKAKESFIKNVLKYNEDKMSGNPRKVIEDALTSTKETPTLTEQLDYLSQQSRKISFWNEEGEERSYRSSLMTAMEKMRKQEKSALLGKFGSTIDLEEWSYSEQDQAMIYVKGGKTFKLGFDSEFDGNYESNVLNITSTDLPGGIYV